AGHAKRQGPVPLSGRASLDRREGQRGPPDLHRHAGRGPPGIDARGAKVALSAARHRRAVGREGSRVYPSQEAGPPDGGLDQAARAVQPAAPAPDHSADQTVTERNRTPYESVLDTVGWTPLIRLNRVTRGIKTPVYGKAEFFNSGGSVKDRIGLPIIERAEREGKLKPGGTIVEGTSGNTGVGLAIAAAIKGYKCIFTMPDKMSQEKVRLLKAFGAEVIVTPTAVPPDHPDNYVMVAKRIASETPNAILANQFYNAANPEAHYRTTGPELWEQTDGRITHFVASAGTGGTITGVGRFLKERNPRIRIIAGDPAGSILADAWRHGGSTTAEGAPYKVEGVGQDKIPGTLDLRIIDDYRTVSDKD